MILQRHQSTNSWHDTVIAGFASDKRYVVETNTKVIERCMLMTTDPGDLVLDPTCGSGTTAYVAEQWGRRWITIDTSRVAVAIARQRLLTAKYDYYQLRVSAEDVRAIRTDVAHRPDGKTPGGTFAYKTVPHITLKSIAQNPNLDPIFAKHEPILAAKLLGRLQRRPWSKVTEGRCGSTSSLGKLRADKDAARKASGRVTDADRRTVGPAREGQKAWEHWTVPFDTDPDWPKDLQARGHRVPQGVAGQDGRGECLHRRQRRAGGTGRSARAVIKACVRVSGPFTVEAVQPPELSWRRRRHDQPDRRRPDALDGTFELARTVRDVEPRTTGGAERRGLPRPDDRPAELDGVRFPNNKEMTFTRLGPADRTPPASTPRAAGYRRARRTPTRRARRPSASSSARSTGRSRPRCSRELIKPAEPRGTTTS